MAMDMQKVKNFFHNVKQKTKDILHKWEEFTTQKLSQTSFLLKNVQELEACIASSENNVVTLPSGEMKVFERHAIVIFWEKDAPYFKTFLYYLPVLVTKGFSQNTKIKIIDINTPDLQKETYQIETLPALLVFTNKKISAQITWEENIKKIITSFELNIHETIEKLKQST